MKEEDKGKKYYKIINSNSIEELIKEYKIQNGTYVPFEASICSFPFTSEIDEERIFKADTTGKIYCPFGRRKKNN